MKRKAILCVAAAVLAGWATGWAAETPVYRAVKADEIRAREGVGHVMAKIRAGEEITVAYLGGSITAMNGWRNKTTEWLKATYPRASFKEVHAAIGGTGSDLGVFRLGRDVLAYKPDLLFVEFATNDGGQAPEQIWRSMEGIVRQTWKQDPLTDIVFTYTITTAFTNDYLNGMCNRSASAMELLADHYGIPSINFGIRVAQLLKENKLIMDAKVIETAVPKESPDRDKQIREMIAADKRLLFANDGVHPREEGHELYKAAIVAGLTRMKDLPATDHQAKLAKAFVADNWEAAKMIPLSAKMLSGNWQALPKDDGKQKAFGDRMGQIWTADQPGSKLHFKFKGSVGKIYDLLGPDGGQVTITVDGKPGARPVPRFDSYCTYHRIATLGAVAGSDMNSVHEVTVEIHPEQPDRQSVAFRLKDPAKELKAPKFQGTRVWMSQLMLLGDLSE
ncbi:MAG TPA: GDSL-type esterase/lipase family protein [Kiritimatiellia bacterium]|nr:GDSL-type esterase/lipase family protein [Kiritimatiellia bacterium]HPS06156.1 GDSL-type esterase/lipase family protein [Kiritimatiellia bacterium]